MICIGGSMASLAGQPLSSATKLSTLFAESPEITLQGRADAPLFGATDPLITKNRIYVADYIGHRVLMFDKQGRPLKEIGTKGEGQGEFQMPYGVVEGRNGAIYVNDRGNGRVQALDPNLNPKAIFRVGGQNEQLFTLPGTGPVKLLMQGVVRCAEKVGCLLTRIDTDDGHLSSFGTVDTTVTMFTWKAALGDDGQLYLINSLGQSIMVYDANGHRVRQIPIHSPSMIAFKSTDSAGGAQLANVMLRLKKERYTVVKRLTSSGPYLFVQFEVVNPVPGEAAHLLDVYDTSGCLRYHGIPTPGLLTRNGGTLFFFDRKSDGLGSVSVRPVRPRFAAPGSCPQH
jgi:hypothetical protein